MGCRRKIDNLAPLGQSGSNSSRAEIFHPDRAAGTLEAFLIGELKWRVGTQRISGNVQTGWTHGEH